MHRILTSLFLFVLFYSSLAQAAPVRLSGNFSVLSQFSDTNAELDIQATPSGEISLPSPLVISGRIKELGRFRAVFTVQKMFQGTDKKELIALQGKATLRRKKEALVSAVLKPTENGGYKLFLDFMDEGKVRYRVKRTFRLIRITALLNQTRGKWDYDVLSFKREGKRPVVPAVCGSEGLTLPAQQDVRSVTSELQTSATYKVMSILLDGDTLYEGMVGNITTGITTMMNLVDSWYKRDLGIAFDVTINPNAVSYDSSTGTYTDGEGYSHYFLHDEMQEKRPASSRSQYIHFLVTGKYSESVAGVAFVSQACVNKDYAIGFTVWFDGSTSFNYETTAHEIGHIFGAGHDDEETGTVAYLMNSGTSDDWSGYLDEFSDFSKSEIASHVSENNSCMTNGSGNIEEGGETGGGGNSGENPSTLQVLLKKKKRPRRAIIIGKYDDNTRADSKPVELLCGYTTDDLSISQDFSTLNTRGRRKIRYRPRTFPAYCKAVVYDDDYETSLGESEVMRLGRDFGG